MVHPVDGYVGKRVRHRRRLVGMTQQQLAEQVGIKFQQLQKYETGANRISASRLWDISDALSVSVTYFFEGLSDEQVADPTQSDVSADLLASKETGDLLRCYYTIPENKRRSIVKLARVLSK